MLQRAHQIVIYPQRNKGIRPRRFGWPAAPFLSDGMSWSVHFCPTEYRFAILRKKTRKVQSGLSDCLSVYGECETAPDPVD